MLTPFLDIPACRCLKGGIECKVWGPTVLKREEERVSPLLPSAWPKMGLRAFCKIRFKMCFKETWRETSEGFFVLSWIFGGQG